MKCKINSKSGEYECKRGDGTMLKGQCARVTKNNGGGLSVLGNGGSLNLSNSNLDCKDSNDFRKILSKKYPSEKIDFEEDNI